MIKEKEKHLNSTGPNPAQAAQARADSRARARARLATGLFEHPDRTRSAGQHRRLCDATGQAVEQPFEQVVQADGVGIERVERGGFDADGTPVRAELVRAPTTAAAAVAISLGIQTMLAKAMNMLPEEIDSEKAPNAYGVDSLVAIGLRNWVQGNCGVEISLFEVLSEKTVREMSVMIAERGGFGDAD